MKTGCQVCALVAKIIDKLKKIAILYRKDFVKGD